MEKKYGKEGPGVVSMPPPTRQRCTEDPGGFRRYEQFVIPDDVGGRFSVLTAVGLLPIAAAGVDIAGMMKGAQDAYVDCKSLILRMTATFTQGS